VKPAIVVTCEHGGNRVPARYRKAFARAGADLASHRGWDEGALVVAREVARMLDAPLFSCTTTRLLVDTNRSLRHPRVFSDWSRSLPAEERGRIVDRFWRPHRAAVEDLVRTKSRRRGVVLHLSIHSFAPFWDGHERAVDVACLYDPARRRERAFVSAWLGELRARAAELRLRRNEPYKGTADGLTTALRRSFDEERYLGIELELSQGFPRGAPERWKRLRRDLADSLRAALTEARIEQWMDERDP
jgi:predicted N-formylglutamate amidohydrolase